MKYRSEIRESQINTLIEKVENKNYGKYLYSIELEKVRGFINKNIKFEFPVTAIIGTNGGGKTTILGAAACAYKDIKPGRFFSKSGKYDNSMRDWKMNYELIDKSIDKTNFVKRSAKFSKLKWTRDNLLSREVHIFDVSRTVSAIERTELKKCASNNFSVLPENERMLNQSEISAIGKVLGKDVTGFKEIKISEKGKLTFLSGRTNNGIGYSEFHFGAGESSIIRMIITIENSSDNSLILIEEIENGLHPLATLRLVEYLISVAERKKVQILFTTHSNNALLPLPNKAIWASVGNYLHNGRLDIESLRAINGLVDSQSIIFTEDEFAAEWIKKVINYSGLNRSAEIEVHGVQGDGNAVKVHQAHGINPASGKKSICYIDGDSKQKHDSSELIFRLPGEMPESYIYLKVKEKMDLCDGELAVSLHQRFEDGKRVSQVIGAVWNTNHDRHLLYSQVGEQVGYVSEETVKSAFLSVWAKHYPEEVESIANNLKNAIENN